jgi:hypothetical protein
MAILSTTPQKRKSGKRKNGTTFPPFLSWVKQHVSEIDLGLEVEDAKGIHPIHLNKNQQVLDHFRSLRHGIRSWLEEQWDWSKLKNHACFKDTYYFAGAPERRKQRFLFLLDVDCKRRGTPEGAQAFLAYIASDDCAREYGLSFPRLYTEPSTHGKGGHGFPLLDKWDYGPELINDLLLHRLQPWLNRIAQEKGFDIELVEVKGTLPVIEWGDEKYEVLSYTAGCLGKFPREGEARFDELRNTSVISAYDLLRLPLAEKPPTKKDGAASLREDKAPAVSISGKHITEDMLAGFQEGGPYRIVAHNLLGTHTLPTSGRQVVRVEDVAISLMLGEWFTNHMLPNGAMPEVRWSGLWSSLKLCGDIKRGWCHKRFKVIRDWLTSLGLLDWQDETYEVGWYDEAGQYHKGRAAKWRFSAELMEMLAQTENHGTGHAVDSGKQVAGIEGNARGTGPDRRDAGSDKDGTCPDNGEKGRHPLWEQFHRESRAGDSDEGERGRHPLWEQILHEWVQSLNRTTDAKITCPVEQVRRVIYQFNPDEITRMIAPFEAPVSGNDTDTARVPNGWGETNATPTSPSENGQRPASAARRGR